MTSPVQRPQPEFQDQVMMQHDPSPQHSQLHVHFNVMVIGVWVVSRTAAAEKGDYDLEFQMFPNNLACTFDTGDGGDLSC